MDEKKILADRFEASRPHLRSVAYRMLGTLSEADDAVDAVQETWLRLSRSDTGEVENLCGWLTTVLSRVCLDMLRSRKSRHEEPLEAAGPEPAARHTGGPATDDPEHEMLSAELVGLALLVMLQRLAPTERAAFVLHDLFDVPFEDIAPVVGRSPAATRQLPSRARRRVRGAPAVTDPDLAGQRIVVDAFLAASRSGDFEALMAVLDPDIVFHADLAAVRLGSMAELRGAAAVAGAFKGRAQAARSALVDGVVGVIVAPRGRLLLVLRVTVRDGRIVELEATADSERLRDLDLAVLAG